MNNIKTQRKTIECFPVRLEIFVRKLDIQGNILCKDGHDKDRNGKDITEAEEINRWQEYTEELYKKGLNDPDDHDGVIIHLKPDIMECEVKWAAGSITMNKASGGDGIQLSYFKS